MKTEIGQASGYNPELLAAAFEHMPMLESVDVSQAVLYVLGTKPHVQVMITQLR